MTRLVQLIRGSERRVARIEEPRLKLLVGADSVVALARQAIDAGVALTALIRETKTDLVLEYDPIYKGQSDWRLLPALDHPEEPARCLVTGTGLTHLGSAKNRAAMHEGGKADETDSMKMFRRGLEGGKPAPGKVGAAPEWFYKGCGTVLRAHGQPLIVPAFAEDGGEEAEIAGAYYIGPDGTPWRIGMTVGNEFSDHVFEKGNYLNLAGSKLRTCAVGPELVVDPKFESVPGKVQIERAGREVWTKPIASGESEMSHSLRNLEHHHFKFDAHRRPGDVHVHFLGAHSISFGDGVRLADGDMMVVQFEGFGRPLRNSISLSRKDVSPIQIRSLA
jgi:hypothetical protein